MIESLLYTIFFFLFHQVLSNFSLKKKFILNIHFLEYLKSSL